MSINFGEEEMATPSEPDLSEGDQGLNREKTARSAEVSSSTLLWLRETGKLDQTPITDRYEQKLLAQLIDYPGSSLQEIDSILCEAFTGLYTPPLEFILLCLASYSTQDSAENNKWYLRAEDDPIERQLDLARAAGFIQDIGERLGFTCTVHNPSQQLSYLSWSDTNQNQSYRLFPTTSAAITDIVLTQDVPSMKDIIVLPGSRANILVYKLRRDPRLARAFHPEQGNWRFLKFRHLRSLAETLVLNRENLDQLLNLDPISFTTPQLWLI
jgi:hypothetical protein